MENGFYFSIFRYFKLKFSMSLYFSKVKVFTSLSCRFLFRVVTAFSFPFSSGTGVGSSGVGSDFGGRDGE